MDANDVTKGEIDDGFWDYDVVMRARDIGMKFGDERDQKIADLYFQLRAEQEKRRQLKKESPAPGTDSAVWERYYNDINACHKREHDLVGEIEKVAGTK